MTKPNEKLGRRAFTRLLCVLLGALFVGLTVWTTRLPVLRGSAWSLKDTAIRAGALLAGVSFLLLLIANLIPFSLDRIEKVQFAPFVAARHVRSRKSGFLTVISVLSICGVALSSCALSSVVSVMGGFREDLKRKILGNNGHILVDTVSQAPFADYEQTLARIQSVPGVTGASPIMRGQVMLTSVSNLAGVIVNGVDSATINGVVDLPKIIEVGQFSYLEHPETLARLPPDEIVGIGPGGETYKKGGELLGGDDLDPVVRAAIFDRPLYPGIVVGRELAKTLHVYVGDEVTLVSPLGDLGPMGVMPRTRKFRVAAIFFSGMYEYDASFVYTTLAAAQDYFNTRGKVSAIEIKVEDAERVELTTPAVALAVNEAGGDGNISAAPKGAEPLRVRDWREMNKNLFSALMLERLAMFIILSIAIMVASFCIICTLLLMVTEKGKDIAILKALGATDGAILRTFILEGVIIGTIGTVFGIATGVALCTGLLWFGVKLDPDVYYIDRLPISVNPADFIAVALSSFIICTIATIYPAFAASKLRPVQGLTE